MVTSRQVDATNRLIDREEVRSRIEALLPRLGESAIDSVPYDTAWVARLSAHMPDVGFEAALEWLRRMQHPDGSWGSSLLHYHDRVISTLAAVVALHTAGKGASDAHRVEQAVRYLWRVGGKMHRDASDTVGYAVLAVALVSEARAVGLDVPKDLCSDAATVERKLNLLGSNPRLWRYTTMSFSLETVRSFFPRNPDFLEDNASVGTSPAATAALLMSVPDTPKATLAYLQDVVNHQGDGGAPSMLPFEVYEAAWALNYLRYCDMITPSHPQVRRMLDLIAHAWKPEHGLSWSRYYVVSDLEDTAVGFTVLNWGGYPVQADAFAAFEDETHFRCFPGEVDPSLSVNLRTLTALRSTEHPRRQAWTEKIIKMLRRQDLDGHFWFDKWHASPYYLAATAVSALLGTANDVLAPRIKWILRTQRRSGGWGHFGRATPEETAFSMHALLTWNNSVERVAPALLAAAAAYLAGHMDDVTFEPMWIAKSLYTPRHIVRAVVLSALHRYLDYARAD